MKKITCDICKKDTGTNVSFSMQTPTYGINEFDAGFNYSPRQNADICNDCYNKIAEAQSNAIKKIKETNH